MQVKVRLGAFCSFSIQPFIPPFMQVEVRLQALEKLKPQLNRQIMRGQGLFPSSSECHALRCAVSYAVHWRALWC